MDTVIAYIGLGANLGDAQRSIGQAIAAIHALAQTTVVKTSSLYRSTPIDSPGPDYTNAVVQIKTNLCAPELLRKLQNIEHAAGRERSFRNAPRTLDLDILLYGDAHISSAELTVPHPRMWQRAFVLRPLHEIAPAVVSSAQLSVVADQKAQRTG